MGVAVPAQEVRPGRGIALAVVAVSCFAILSALVKAADRIPTGEVVFFRAVLTLPVLLLWLGAGGRLGALRTTRWRGHALRGIVGTTAMGLSFTALHLLPLPEVTALQFATPILIVIFAALMLGEPVRLVRLTAVAVGLAGVVVILAPRLTAQGDAAELLGAGVALTSAALAALAQVFVKRMSRTESPEAIVFYFALTATVMSLVTLPFGWVMPRGGEWGLLLGAGAIGCVGQLFLTASYRHADASVLAPFTYVSMIWAIAIGWGVFGEAPTLAMLAGASLIVASGIVIVLRERQLGLRRAAEAKVGARGFS